MKINKYLAVIASMLSLAATANAAIITTFTNLDFDSGGVSNPFNGFDAPGSPEIIGWSNMPNAFAPDLDDAGVEGSGAWWGPYQNNAAFMSDGDGAYNLSGYTIQAGDTFSIDFYAERWFGNGAWTVSLYYDIPANVIGSYTTPNLNSFAWTLYSTPTPIAATGASVGGTLGIIFMSSGADAAALDEPTVNVTSVPEPGSMALVVLGGLGMLARLRRRS